MSSRRTLLLLAYLLLSKKKLLNSKGKVYLSSFFFVCWILRRGRPYLVRTGRRRSRSQLFLYFIFAFILPLADGDAQLLIANERSYFLAVDEKENKELAKSGTSG